MFIAQLPKLFLRKPLVSDGQPNEQVDEFNSEKRAAGVCEHGEHTVAVLDNGAGQKNAEGDKAFCVKGCEDQVGA